MKKIIAFAGSNSINSINKKLASYVATQLNNVHTEVLDLNDYELPLYGIDYEVAHGIPDNAQLFLNKIKEADGIVISLAEHNGNFSAAFKNLYDWMSRIEGKVWNDKAMFLLATSPGGRGGATIFELAKNSFPRMGAQIKASFSLPSFSANFSDEGIVDATLKEQLYQEIETFNTFI
jgi:NAD(P)H-dependent FMN reductase